MIKKDDKDWQVALSMFGKNTKKECALVRRIRKRFERIEKLCDGWYVLYEKGDETGWLVEELLVVVPLVLDADGHQVVVFNKGLEYLAEEYVNLINNKYGTKKIYSNEYT